MNIINATILRNNFANTINTLKNKKDYLLVSKRGKITSALVDIDLFEDLVSLSNKKFLKTIKKARNEYEKGDIFTHDQVFGNI